MCHPPRCHVPIHACLYRKEVQRSYLLMRGDGTPLKVKVFDEQSHTPFQRQVVAFWPCMQSSFVSRCALARRQLRLIATGVMVCICLTGMQGIVHVAWKILLPKLKVVAGDKSFVPIGTSIKDLNGTYTKRFVGGASYSGSWQGGVPHGRGKFISEEGTVYEGEWSWSKMHGKGTFRYSNGDVYAGVWKDNFRHGLGTCTACNGDVYTGEWRFGYQHGRGRHETEDGMVYDGEWKENRAHGCGLITEPDGSKWDGTMMVILQDSSAQISLNYLILPSLSSDTDALVISQEYSMKASSFAETTQDPPRPPIFMPRPSTVSRRCQQTGLGCIQFLP